MRETAFGILIALLFISLVILFCIILIKLYIKKIKTYTRTLYQKDLDFQKTLNQAIIETQEQVLNNISQDLHDDAGQQLTYINFQLENLKLDSPELNKMLEPLSESVGSLSQSIRGISHALNNQLLLGQDLSKAMQAEVARLQKNRKIKIQFSHDGKSGKAFSSNEKIIIYRIFQEAINNIFKHARAKAISISIRTEPVFSMEISDNGKGFDTGQAMAGKHSLGLKNMASRAHIINYELKLQSAPGQGTTVTLSDKPDNHG